MNDFYPPQVRDLLIAKERGFYVPNMDAYYSNMSFATCTARFTAENWVDAAHSYYVLSEH